MSDDQQASQHKFKLGRIIVSPDKETRQKGITTLKSWLKKYTKPTELDYLKVWKALFYCVWVTDNTTIQYELVQKLAKLVHVLPDNDCFFLFITAFYKTINREWQGIDKYRIEKYLWLLRFFFYECLCFLQKQDWNEEVVDVYNVTLLENLFITKDYEVHLGIKMHIVDIFYEEIKKILGDEFWTIPAPILLTIFYPFFCILSSSNDTVLKDHIEQSIFDEILIFFFDLKVNLVSEEGKNPDIEPIRKSMRDLAQLIYIFDDFLFSLASSKKTSNTCRKQLYQIHLNIKSNMKTLDENEEEVNDNMYGSMDTSNDTDENRESGIDSIDIEKDIFYKKDIDVSNSMQEETFASTYLRSEKTSDSAIRNTKSNAFKKRRRIIQSIRNNGSYSKLGSKSVSPPTVHCEQQPSQLSSTMINCDFSDEKTQSESYTPPNVFLCTDVPILKTGQSACGSRMNSPSNIYSDSILGGPPPKKVNTLKKVCFSSITMVKRYSTRERIQPTLPASLTSQPSKDI